MSGNTVNYNLSMSQGWTAPKIDFSSWGSGSFNNYGTSSWSAPMFGFNNGGTTWGATNFNGGGFGGTTTVSSSGTSSSSKTKKKAKSNTKVDYNASKNFKGLTRQEEKLITAYSTKKKEYVENLGTSLAFGAGLGVVLPNADKIVKPINASSAAFSSKSATNELFKDVVKQDLWKSEPRLMQEAYAQMHKAEMRANKWKWQSLFKRPYETGEFNLLKDQMQKALSGGNKTEILEATAKLSQANGIGDGFWSNTLGKVKTFFGGSSATSKPVSGVIANVDSNTVMALKNSTSSSFKDIFRSSIGIKDASGKFNKMGLGMALLSLAFEWNNIKAGFKKDTETGFKQLGQSVLKAGGAWFGYALGDAIGKWGGAKLGAMIGTAICPALGTAIGAVAGLICGTVCSWGVRKLATLAVGDNVANKYIAKEEIENAKTKEEKATLISGLVSQAQNDKDIDEKTAAALAKAQQLYAVA